MLAAPSSRLRFSLSRPVAASQARVFDALTSEEGMRQWLPMCRSAHWQHPDGKSAPGLGSIRQLVLAGGVVADERIIGWEPGVGLQYTLVDPAMPLARLTENYVGVTYIEPTSTDRCVLHWAAHFDGRGVKGFIAPGLAAALRPVVSGMAGRLKKISERS